MQLHVISLVLIILAASNCGSAPTDQSGNEWSMAWRNLKAAFGNIGDWFSRQFHGVEDLFAKSRDDLKRKVNETVKLLQAVKDHQLEMLNWAKEKADNATQAAIKNVDAYFQEVNEFQQRVRNELNANYDQLKKDWEMKTRTMYNGGLDKIIASAQQLKTIPQITDKPPI